MEIAKKYNCSTWTINHRLIKNNIKLRSSTDFLKWKKPGNSINPNINVSPTLSYTLGVLVGDGWTYKYGYTCFIGLDSVEKDFCIEFLNALKQIGLNPKLIYRGKRGWRTIACSKIFYDWYKSLKFNDMKNIATKYPIQFLKGFHESEGCTFINKTHKGKYKTPAIVITNTNKNLIDLTKELLENLNFHPTVNFRYYSLPYSSCWRLNLFRKQEVLRFLNEVKPIIKNLNNLKIPY